MRKSFKLNSRYFLLVPTIAVLALNACSPAPRRQLVGEDKTADMYWLFSQFNENYAPLEYKQTRYGFNYENLKQQYLAAAQTTQNNDEFYKLMYKFVSEFKDAHTSASLTNASLPMRAKIAYLGFTGKRVGNKLAVTERLPTITATSEFPVKVGDEILEFDGKPLVDVVKNEMAVYRDLGSDEANLTMHMPRIFARLSTVNGLPSSDTALLKVKRGSDVLQVVLPWVVKDLYQFRREQAAATPANGGGLNPEDSRSMGFKLGFLQADGTISPNMPDFLTTIRGLPEFNFMKTFKFVDDYPLFGIGLERLDNSSAVPPTPVAPGTDTAPIAALRRERDIPQNAIPITAAVTYPAYVTREKVLNGEGRETGAVKLVGYIRLDTFSPMQQEPKVLEEFGKTLEAFQELGVRDIAIDLIDNGGGSLVLGMKLAQLLSNEKVVQPEIQFRISESWLDEFENGSLQNDSDAERELSRRVYEGLVADKASGLRLSRKFNVEALSPFSFARNEKLTNKFNVVLLVNEMCASMCDIFSGIMKDNNLVTIVGTKTMGAGGNVVNHPQAPNSHMSVRQTESLIVRKDGTYVENNGIDPDVVVNVSESSTSKYGAVRAEAMKLLVTQH